MTITAAPPPVRPAARRAAGSAFLKGKCGTCIALCCRYFALEVDRPTEPKDFDTLRWYMLHERVHLFLEGRKWFVQVFNPCSALGPDNRCTIYATRPGICREYSNDDCDKDEVPGEELADPVFRTLEELEAYRLRWVKRYEAAQRRKRRLAAERGARTRRRRARARRR